MDYVLYDMSYVNMIMYGSVLPSCKSKKGAEEIDNEVVNADDPLNREKVRAILYDE